jgi:hypothetical protein
MMDWIQQHPMTIAGLVLWMIGILWLMPGKNATKPRPHLIGVLITAVWPCDVLPVLRKSRF